MGSPCIIIGNGAYVNAPTLANPKNHAEDMAAALKGVGFTVILGIDLDKHAMDRKILEFAGALSGAETGVFHYSGHGLQVAGVNYIVPIDAALDSAAALDFEAVRLDLIQPPWSARRKRTSFSSMPAATIRLHAISRARSAHALPISAEDWRRSNRAPTL